MPRARKRPATMRVQVVQASEPLDEAKAVDALGKKSAIAQALSHEITSANLFAMPVAVQQQQTLRLSIDADDSVVGFLKTGRNTCFTCPRGEYIEMDPLCVLDFYVDEAWQHCGVGLQLFQHLLKEKNITPAQLAYDRPSPKLFAFLKKHADLTKYFPQPNHFVIFDAYFLPCP